MAYIALYRKYRSQNFDEIAGQSVIVKTLKNAIKYDKIAHAYIFSGPRGTGKTSIAKIFGKAINCLHPIDGNPCNNCEVCKSISDHEVSDIIEIDAASNNGVDEIRDIRDKVRYTPSVGKYKVYIIDEVHMLTTGAFNALLKTLEEPPKHVIFILATTEIHKIPATILSRCQRYDFKNIDTKDMTERLNTVVKNENIKITSEAIEAICNFAEGGMRDALSILDQVLSFNAEQEITEDDVQRISGGLSKSSLIDLIDSVTAKNIPQALKVVEDLFKDGKDVLRVASDLISAFKEILLDKTRNNKKYPEFNDVDINLIYEYIDIVTKLQQDIRFTNQKKTYLEIAVLKMIESKQVTLIDIETKVNKLINGQITTKQVQEPTSVYVKPIEIVKEEIKEVEPILEEQLTPTLETTDLTNQEVVTEKPQQDSVEESFEEIKKNDLPQEPIKEVIKEQPINSETIYNQTNGFTEFKQKEPVTKEVPLVTVAQLQEVLDHADKAKRELTVKHWDFFGNHPVAELASASKLLHQGQLVAISNNKAIIVFSSTLISKKMYEPQNKELILKIFNNRSEFIQDYYAITRSSWDQLMDQYKIDRANGIENPKFKDIDLGLYQTVTENQSESELKRFADWFKGN